MTTTQRWTLAVVTAATAMIMLDVAVVNTALPSIADDLRTGPTGLQWVVDAYTLALAATVLSAGSLADRLGRRRVLAAGLVVFTGASIACALAPTIATLGAARAVQGVGGAALLAVSLAVLAHAFPGRAERARALGAYGAAIGGAVAVGPAVGGAISSGLDWRFIFALNVPVGVAALVVARRRVAESRDPAARPIDWAGQVTFAGGLLLLVLVLLRAHEAAWTSTATLLQLAGAATLLGAFVVVERRVAAPMLPLGLFRIRAFTGAQVAVVAIAASFFAGFLYTTLYLTEVAGLSALEAGLAYLPATTGMFVVSALTPRLAARVEPARLAAAALALVAAGMAAMTLAGAGSSWTAIVPGLVIACAGVGLFNPSIGSVALGALPVAQSGLAAGVNATFRQAGVAVGVAALGALAPVETALGGSPDAYVDGFHVALLAGAALAAAGAVATVLLIRPPRAAPRTAAAGAQPSLAAAA